MTEPSESVLDRITKLLAMAERGATEAERDAFNAKATALMIMHAVDTERLRNFGGPVDDIIKKSLTIDCPKTYSYEYALIVNSIAMSLNCQMYVRRTNGREIPQVVGHRSDVATVELMAASLIRQCTLALGPWYRNWVACQYYPSGTDKFQAKRGFISGFSRGVRDKLAQWKKTVVDEAGSGTELALVDRADRVNKWISDNMRVGSARGRAYGSSTGDGWSAGYRSDIGSPSVGGVRKSIGG